MGYRMYLGSIKKTAPTPIIENENYRDVDTDQIEKLFELGKYVIWRPDQIDHLYNEEDELYFVGKEFLLYLIEEYRKLNYLHFSDMLEKYRKIREGELPLDSAEAIEIDTYFSMKGGGRYCEWSKDLLAYNLDTEKKHIVTSWKYEYLIFELVHILHTFDWENNQLVYYGY